MKNLTIIILLFYITNIFSDENLLSSNLFFFGAGPSWSNFDQVTTYDYKSDTSMKLKNQYKINIANGYQISTFIYLNINKYVSPFMQYINAGVNGGNGFVKSVNTRTNEVVEYYNFLPQAKSNYFAIGNYAQIYQTKYSDIDFYYYFFAGYNISTIHTVAKWEDDTSFSDSTWYGAALGFATNFSLNDKISFWIEDDFYPDRIKTCSTRDSVIGEEGGYESLILFSNYISGTCIYQLPKIPNASLGISLCYGYYTKVGQVDIKLAQSDQQLFTNPKVNCEKGNYGVLLFDIFVTF